VSGFADFSNALSDEQRFAIIKRGNPQMTDEQVGQYLYALEERYDRKKHLIERGYSNALAEKALDKQGWPRPFGWHSVFFYPDSNRPRTRYAVLAILVIAFAVWKLTNNG